MSANLRDIREISNSPNDKFVSHLAKKISDFANAQQTQDLENKEDIYSSAQDVDSKLSFHNFVSNKQFTNIEYFPPNEPDGDKVRVFIKPRNMGDNVPDMSGEGNTGFIEGEPILVDGYPFDDGISTGGFKSLALRFNRPTSITRNEEGMYVYNAARNRASEALSSGISFFIRFRVFSLSQQGGADRRLFEKTDNNPVTDGVIVRVSSSGRIKVVFENSNVQYLQETTNAVISADDPDNPDPSKIYDLWVTFNKTGNAIKIYVNGVDQSLTSSTTVDYHSDLTDLNWAIFFRGEGSNDGFTYGDLYDFRVYREKIVSQTEVTRMYTNKWTISDIPFGQVMVADYYSAYDEDAGGGPGDAGPYSSVGFNSTGFDTV